MKFDFVDIGTSDFDTSLDQRKKNQNILLMEPVSYYLDRLPNGESIFKNNCAISEKAGNGEIYFVDDEIIKKYNMPSWMRGCNSFNKPHQTVLRFFKEIGQPPEFKQKRVPVLSFQNLVELYEIKRIGFLKIDTEGHDHVVLESVLDCLRTKKIKIKKIKFEYNEVFGNTKHLFNLIGSLTFYYKNIECANDNVIMS